MRSDIITSKIMDADSAKQVLQTFGEQMANPNLSLINNSAAIVSLAHLQHTLTEEVMKDPYMEVLACHAVSRLRSIARRGDHSQHRACGNIFWAIAKLKKRWLSRSLHAASLEAVKATISSMDEQQVANVIWASAALPLEGADMHEVLSAASRRTGEVAHHFIPQHVANILWAMGTLTAQAAPLLPTIPVLVDAAARLEPKMESLDISHIVWSWAKLKEETDMLKLRPTVTHAIGNLANKMDAQDIATVMWSLAELGETARQLSQLLPILLNAFTKISPAHMKQRDVGQVLMVVAKVSQEFPEMIPVSAAVAKLACDVRGQFAERELATALTAIGMLRMEQSDFAPLVRKICKQARSDVASFSLPLGL